MFFGSSLCSYGRSHVVKTTNDAVIVAEYLLELLYPLKCEAVGLFSSVAREGQGSDIDIVIFVPLSFDERRFHMIAARMLEKIEQPTSEDKQKIRQEAARQVLEVEHLCPVGIPEEDVDVLLYRFDHDIEGAIAHLRRLGREHHIEAEISRDLLFFSPPEKNFVRIGEGAVHL